jgi:hypothetical protein
MLHMLGPNRHWTPKQCGEYRRTLRLRRFRLLHVRSGLRISRFFIRGAPEIGAGPISARLLQFLADRHRRASRSCAREPSTGNPPRGERGADLLGRGGKKTFALGHFDWNGRAFQSWRPGRRAGSKPANAARSFPSRDVVVANGKHSACLLSRFFVRGAPAKGAGPISARLLQFLA